MPYRFASLFILKRILSLQNFVLASAAGGRSRSVAAPVRELLILRTGALGDFLVSVPAIARLRDAYGEARITLLTMTTADPKAASVKRTYTGAADNCPWLSFVVPDLIDEAVILPGGSARTMVRSVRGILSGRHVDVAFLLNDPGIPFLSILKRLLLLRLGGLRCPVVGWEMTSTLSFFRAAQHEAGLFGHRVEGMLQSVERSFRLPRAGAAEAGFPVTVLPDACRWADSTCAEHGLSGTTLVAIAPGSLQPHKRWPLDNFKSLAVRLLQEPGVGIVVLGTTADAPLGKELASVSENRILDLTGKTTLQQAAAMLRRCSLLLTNDGGAAHLAASVNTPVVAAMPGIEYPNSAEPWNSRELAVRHEVPCAPCYNFVLCRHGHSRCMMDLPVEPMLRNCLKVLRKDSVSGASPSPRRIAA